MIARSRGGGVMRRHFCVDIFGALAKGDKHLKGMLRDDSGRSLSGAEVREFLQSVALSGKKYFTGCDNETADGQCGGHPDYDSVLHPNGKCVCFGEGRCEWCRSVEVEP